MFITECSQQHLTHYSRQKIAFCMYSLEPTSHYGTITEQRPERPIKCRMRLGLLRVPVLTIIFRLESVVLTGIYLNLCI